MMIVIISRNVSAPLLVFAIVISISFDGSRGTFWMSRWPNDQMAVDVCLTVRRYYSR